MKLKGIVLAVGLGLAASGAVADEKAAPRMSEQEILLSTQNVNGEAPLAAALMIAIMLALSLAAGVGGGGAGAA